MGNDVADAPYGQPCRSSQHITVKCDLGASGVFYATWDKYAVVPLVRACARVKAYNIDNPTTVYKIGSTGFQTFNCRHKKGAAGSWSMHAWPLAIDIDPPSNPWKGSHGTLRAGGPGHYIVDCFKAEGFDWGGDWSTLDQMHVSHGDWSGQTSPTSWDYHDFLKETFMPKLTDAEQTELYAMTTNLWYGLHGAGDKLGVTVPPTPEHALDDAYKGWASDTMSKLVGLLQKIQP